MRKFLLSCLLWGSLIVNVQAAFIVDIYDTPTFNNTNQLRQFMNNNAAIGQYQYDVINFSDWGHKGFFTNENVWPVSVTNTFAAQISGLFEIQQSGYYDFSSWSDDGLDLAIDGNQAIYRPNPHAPTLDTINIFLSAGLHSVDLVWYENKGAAVLELSLADAAGNRQLLTAADISTGNSAIPEPGMLVMIVLGLLLLFWRYTDRTLEPGAIKSRY